MLQVNPKSYISTTEAKLRPEASRFVEIFFFCTKPAGAECSVTRVGSVLVTFVWFWILDPSSGNSKWKSLWFHLDTPQKIPHFISSTESDGLTGL